MRKWYLFAHDEGLTLDEYASLAITVGPRTHVERAELYVGNMAFRTTEAELRDAIVMHGEVESVELISKDGKFSGYGFVGMKSVADVEKAAKALNGSMMFGRKIKANRSSRRPRDANGEELPRPTFHGAHLADESSPDDPTCGALARRVQLAVVPAGFLNACCSCLALSEVRP